MASRAPSLMHQLSRRTASRFASSTTSSIRFASILHRPTTTYRALPALNPNRAFSLSTRRAEAVQPPDYLSEGERKVFDLIQEGLAPTKLEVQDISGGCGSMYGIDIVSEKFKGLSVIKQHRLVNQVLGEEIKKWHGVQLKTKAP